MKTMGGQAALHELGYLPGEAFDLLHAPMEEPRTSPPPSPLDEERDVFVLCHLITWCTWR
jgi:hypothetical protein